MSKNHTRPRTPSALSRPLAEAAQAAEAAVDTKPEGPSFPPPVNAETCVTQLLKLSEILDLRPRPTLQSLPAVFENIVRQLARAAQQNASLRQALKDAL